MESSSLYQPVASAVVGCRWRASRSCNFGRESRNCRVAGGTALAVSGNSGGPETGACGGGSCVLSK